MGPYEVRLNLCGLDSVQVVFWAYGLVEQGRLKLDFFRLRLGNLKGGNGPKRICKIGFQVKALVGLGESVIGLRERLAIDDPK